MQDLFRYPGIPQDQFSMVLLPLFSNEFVYGLVLCDLTENLFSSAEFLLNQMSSAAKNSHVFRKTWIPHFRRCSRMRMQCFTSRNRNEIRMLQKFYQNRN